MAGQLKILICVGFAALALTGCAGDLAGADTAERAYASEDNGEISPGAEAAPQGQQSCEDVLCGEAVVGVPVASLPDPDRGATPGRLTEVACDGIDQDGNGFDHCDSDKDGVDDGLDCAPKDPRVSPHVVEFRCDGIDQNCDGTDDCDRDNDGWLDRRDCAPGDPKVTDACHPKPSGLPQPE